MVVLETSLARLDWRLEDSAMIDVRHAVGEVRIPAVRIFLTLLLSCEESGGVRTARNFELLAAQPQMFLDSMRTDAEFPRDLLRGLEVEHAAKALLLARAKPRPPSRFAMIEGGDFGGSNFLRRGWV